MKIRFRLFCVMLIMLLLSPLAEAGAQDDPVVVRVGDVTYLKSDVQAFYDSMAQQYREAGETLDKAAANELLDMVIEGYVDLGVSELKCAELGLAELNDAQKAEVSAAAQDLYDSALASYVEQIMANFGTDEAGARESAPTLMGLNGYTYEAFYKQQLSQYHNKLILDYVTQGMSITESEIDAHVDEMFVAPNRELYQDNFPQFEQDVLVNGKDCYYFPAGIRMVDIIWLEIPDALKGRITALQAASTDEELAELNELLLELEDHYKKEIAAIGVVTSVGDSYDGILADYPTLRLDSGYLVHAQSSLWGNDMRDAALALENPGNVSDIQFLTGEPCVLCYRANVSEGLPPFDAESIETIRGYAEEDLRVRVLDKRLEDWKKDYDIEIHPEMIDII